MVPILLTASLTLALVLPPAFLAVLVGYYALDMCLFLPAQAQATCGRRRTRLPLRRPPRGRGGRSIRGALPRLTAFAIFLFLSLALVKRCSELADRKQTGVGDPVGRAYRLDDLPLLEIMSVASGYVAILVLALYVQSEDVRVL